MKLVIAVAGDDGVRLSADLQREGAMVLAAVTPAAIAAAAEDAVFGVEAESLVRALAAADAVVLEVTRESLTASSVALCDRAGTRVAPWGAEPAQIRLAAMFGLEAPIPADSAPWRVFELLSRPATAEAGSPRDEAADAERGPRTIVVWGAAGSPGRSTMAVELAVELARGGRHVALVDADTHAPSLALALGLADEGPGFAAACRQAELGGLDDRELTRISQPLGRTGVDVLAGVNRPSRWPELSAARVAAALGECRAWADYTVVDVAAPLAQDEEIVSDLVDGPRRNAATLAALQAADLVVAVVGSDPLGISRFLRDHRDMRELVGRTPVAVLANRLRPGALGIDARGQVRRTLERFGGIEDVWFAPEDARSADAAVLSGRPIAEVAPKGPLTAAVRRFVGEAVVPAPAPARR